MRDDSDDDEERTTMTKKPRTINETSPPSTPSSSRKDCSPLWHLVTDLPLLFSEKILDTKLDKTSVKLFFETNRAARALVKNYSPRVYQTHVRGEMLGKESSSSNNNNNDSDEAVVEGAVESSNFDGIVSACLTNISRTLCSREFKTHHTRPCYLLAVKRLRNGRHTR